MKRLILLLVIGAVVFALSFACTTDQKQQTKPEEGDTIEQETLGLPEGDSADTQGVSKVAGAIEQETLQRGEEEPLKQDR